MEKEEQKPKLERLYTLKEASILLGVSVFALRNWDKKGIIRTVRTPGGQRRIPESELIKLLGGKPEEVINRRTRCVIYARVSSSRQRDEGDLDRQIFILEEFAKKQGWEVVEIIKDVGSGLNERRRGLKKLFKLVVQRKIDVVLITNKDRLTRFGYRYLDFFFRSYGVQIITVEKERKKTDLEELIQDFVSLVVSFAGRIYGKRSHKTKKLLEEITK